MYRHRYGGSTCSTPASSRRESVDSSDDRDKCADDKQPGSDTESKKPKEEVASNFFDKKASQRFSRKPVKMSMTAKSLARKAVEEEDVSHPTVAKNPVKRSDSDQIPKDLMISYSHADKEMMTKVWEKLEQNGISVWVDVSGLKAGVDFLSKIGEAIIDAKLFISLLSVDAVKSRYVQDELALAYVSNTGIFPVAIEDPANFKSLMDTGMKLQLARYEWTILTENNFDEQLDILINKMKAELKKRKEEETEKKDEGRPKLQRPQSRTHLNKSLVEKATSDKENASGANIMPEQFWKNNFKNVVEFDFEQFYGIISTHFKEQIEEYFNDIDQGWLKGIIRREMEVEEDGKLFKYNYDSFCMIDGMTNPLWERILNQAMESHAMKDVFNMESTVRVEAIENLGKFRSAAVIDALRDLLSDEDANVRAVASVSLARTEANDPVTLKFLSKTLNDKDRLVREAGCLALGHLQAKQAVSKLLHLWRNDVISHVREAAQVALQQIGGPDVEKAMHVTKVLADEIRQLTKQ